MVRPNIELLGERIRQSRVENLSQLRISCLSDLVQLELEQRIAVVIHEPGELHGIFSDKTT